MYTCMKYLRVWTTSPIGLTLQDMLQTLPTPLQETQYCHTKELTPMLAQTMRLTLLRPLPGKSEYSFCTTMSLSEYVAVEARQLEELRDHYNPIVPIGSLLMTYTFVSTPATVRIAYIRCSLFLCQGGCCCFSWIDISTMVGFLLAQPIPAL